MATLKPTTPLHTHNKAPLKPPSPLRRKTHQKHPILTRKGDGGFNSPTSPARKGDDGFKPPGHLANRARPRRPWALKPCPTPPFHTWTLQPARGPDDMRVGH